MDQTHGIERLSAAGNVFHVALDLDLPDADAAALAMRLSAGEGLVPLPGSPPPRATDGLILCSREPGRAPRQRMFNPDGSAGLCVNGLRCLAYLLSSRQALPADGLIETDDGPMSVRVDGEAVEARLGTLRAVPGFPPPSEPCPIEIDGELLQGHVAFVGNTQLVLHGDAELQERIGELGARLQGHPRFPDGVNVGIVHSAEDIWRVRVWERGVGETLSCGSNSLAVAAAGPRGIGPGQTRELEYPGGVLRVTMDADGRLRLSGTVTREGRYRPEAEIDIKPGPQGPMGGDR